MPGPCSRSCFSAASTHWASVWWETMRGARTKTRSEGPWASPCWSNSSQPHLQSTKAWIKRMIDTAASIGGNCDIHPSAVIGAGVSMGNGVFIGAGVIVNGRCVIGEHCHVAAGSVLDPGGESAGSELVLENGV